ncbi:MAG TPA: hypothetical protein VFR67_08960 [Pilimelia sp.]|nr:hypothetical protein [Pilimelia sp.]
MRTRYLGWFAVGMLISIAATVGYALVSKACHRQEAAADTTATAAEEQAQPVA